MQSVQRDNLFITIEGVEGVGKSTCITFIRDYLQQHQLAFTLTREPGGTLIAEKIRRLLLDEHDEQMHSDAELLLVFAARAQHLQLCILPALARGEWVVCDRFTDASYAYQGAGRGIHAHRIAALEQWVQQDVRPDLTFLLDAPLAIAMQRAKKRGAMDRFESEQIEFFEKVQACYRLRAEQYPDRFHIVDASVDVGQVKTQLEQIMQRYIR